MKTSLDDAPAFREECLWWQQKLGLQDWSLRFKVKEADSDRAEALTDYDCDTRYADVTYYTGVEDATHPSDLALHEMLHLLLADMLLAAVEADSEEDAKLGREEHRVIERLHGVMTRLRRR